MSINQFFEKKGPFPLREIAKVIGSNENFSSKNDLTIHNFETLDNATNKDVTFLNSIR